VSGYPALLLQRSLMGKLGGRCVQTSAGVLARDGSQHADCSTCNTPCESAALGFSGGVEVGRVWGSDAIELRWACPGCGCETTQETTALTSFSDAAQVQADPHCYACRKPANVRGNRETTHDEPN
jgi:hypothetical protein